MTATDFQRNLKGHLIATTGLCGERILRIFPMRAGWYSWCIYNSRWRRTKFAPRWYQSEAEAVAAVLHAAEGKELKV